MRGLPGLNTKTPWDRCAFPRINQCNYFLGESSVLSVLDCDSGYWQIPVLERGRDRTTFSTHLGAYQYTLTRFGFENAPVSIQRALEIIFLGFRWPVCHFYLDKVPSFYDGREARPLPGLRAHVRSGCRHFAEAKKCFFFQPPVFCVGHVV